MGCYHSEDLFEHSWCYCFSERKNPKLVMFVSYQKTEKLVMDWVNIYMELSDLHVESHEPGSLEEEGNN